MNENTNLNEVNREKQEIIIYFANCIQGRNVNEIDIVEWVNTLKGGIVNDEVNYFEYMELWKDNCEAYDDCVMDPSLKPKLLPEIVKRIKTDCYN